MEYYNREVEEIMEELNSSTEGLDSKEAEKRLREEGKNELPRKEKESILSIFLNEFKDPMILLLLFAIIASLLSKEVIDAIAILFIVLIDVLIGTYQENKANNTAEALSNLVTARPNVIRDGHEIQIDSSDVVVGDIIILDSGDKIPADARIIEAHNLTTDESILTGESINVSKNSNIIEGNNISLGDRINMLYSGTIVVSGRAKAIVVATALETEIGHIAEQLNNTKEEKSPLTIRVEKLSKQISMLVIIIAIIITILLYLKNVPYNEIFLSVIALAVSAMPEGLPLALTMALTIASNKMAKKNVVAKKLHSIESLGSCTVIASDKTGTLTVNQQTAKKILLPDDTEYQITGTGYELEGKVIGENLEKAKQLALYGVINNEAILEEDARLGDSIDIAFLVLGEKLKVNKKGIKILETIPYESENKYSAVFYEKENEIYCTIKGSPEKILEFTKNTDLDKIITQNELLAKEGYRVIALANGKVKKKEKYQESDIKNLEFKGLVGFIDPIRKEVISSINECRNAGIKVLMITGDHPLTAFSIAKELNLTDTYDEVTTGIEIEEYLKKNNRTFDNFIKSKKVFSRVTPIQKLKIVESLKRQKEFVAVTGDGVNDAPALKTANLGISMGSGTDIARETAKMIIIDDNFKSIVAGIKEGRVAYANIRKIILFLISCGLAEVLFFCLSIMFNMPLPLLAVQLLWLNVVTDGIQDFALSFEKAEKNIMKEKPRNPESSLLDNQLLKNILISGISIGLIVFVVWYYLIKVLYMNVSLARGYIMALMVFIQNIHVFNCRSESSSAFQVPLKNNKLIVGGVIVSILLQIIVMANSLLSNFLSTSKIPVNHLIILFMIASLVLFLIEIYKGIQIIINNKK